MPCPLGDGLQEKTPAVVCRVVAYCTSPGSSEEAVEGDVVETEEEAVCVVGGRLPTQGNAISEEA